MSYTFGPRSPFARILLLYLEIAAAVLHHKGVVRGTVFDVSLPTLCQPLLSCCLEQ
jgi:hypothetical protein